MALHSYYVMSGNEQWIVQTNGMGKLLVFGGLAGVSSKDNFVDDILARRYSGFTTLNDLWFKYLIKPVCIIMNTYKTTSLPVACAS